MTLNEYFKALQDFINDNPETLDMQVIYSKDSEGNGFSKVEYEPIKGIFEGDTFIDVTSVEEYERDKNEVNSVCIN